MLCSAQDKPRAPALPRTEQLPSPRRGCAALQHEVAHRPGDVLLVWVSQTLQHNIAHKAARTIPRVQALQPCCGVDPIAEDAVLDPCRGANVADQDLCRVYTAPQPAVVEKLGHMHLRVDSSPHSLLLVQRCRGGRVEDGEDLVFNELEQSAIVVLDDFGDAVVELCQKVQRLGGAEVHTHVLEAVQVAEEDRHTALLHSDRRLHTRAEELHAEKRWHVLRP
mmetsp:Transcript_81266/g.211149  ORF Transcript_81266/g.211149 Transcript_81266/m.211149 type:complete len:222 (-) Transcript_81266:306-971(-)